MFFCICHALTKEDIQKAIDQNAATAKEVYSICGVVPECGKCLPVINEELDQSKKCQILNNQPESINSNPI